MDETICIKCQHAQIIEGYNEQKKADLTILCWQSSQSSVNVSNKIVMECNKFWNYGEKPPATPKPKGGD